MISRELKSPLWLFLLVISLLALGATYERTALGSSAVAGEEHGTMSCHALQSGLPFKVCELSGS